MATEPITLFSRRIDPAGVLRTLRQLAPDVKIEGPDDDWTKAIVTVRSGLLRRAQTVTIGHLRDYYDGPDWPRQRAGMAGYFSRFPQTDRTPDVQRLIASLQFALSVQFDPEERIDPPDDRLRFVLAIAKHLDGVLFRPSGLYDAAGRPLCHASGNADPAAVFPAIPAPAHVDADDDEDDEAPKVPPTAERVARRTMAIAAVGARALLEQEDPADPGVEQTRQRLLQWVADIGIGDELEPDEWRVLQTPLRSLLQQDAVNASWRLEGLGVLAWALNRFALPPHDLLCNPGELLPAVGLLNADRARAILAEPPLRPQSELHTFRERQFAIHWRVRDFGLRPRTMDFAQFAATAWFGPLDITGIHLVDGDLALGDDAIAAAPAERVQMAASTAQERHLAANWLHGDSVIYSRTDTPT